MRRKLSDDDIIYCVYAYRRGMSCRQIAVAFGVNHQAVWLRIRRLVTMRPHAPRGTGSPLYRGGPKKVKSAMDTATRAIRLGKLVRPDKCEQCRNDPGTNTLGRTLLHAHHDDYSRPLDVRWLCQQCHFEWHRENAL
jgi:transposase-like protein